MVQAGPDTGTGTWDYCSGYQYRDKAVLGYSQTHLNGTGCLDLGDIQVLPFSGEVGKLPMTWNAFAAAIAFQATCWLVLLFLYRKKLFLKV